MAPLDVQWSGLKWCLIHISLKSESNQSSDHPHGDMSPSVQDTGSFLLCDSSLVPRAPVPVLQPHPVDLITPFWEAGPHEDTFLLHILLSHSEIQFNALCVEVSVFGLGFIYSRNIRMVGELELQLHEA